jgi:HEPN domain-containing protein
MTSRAMAQAYVRAARVILGEAEGHQTRGIWHLAVRRCQESVEMALKAVLRAAGVEVPRVHDVGAFLREHAERLPKEVTAHLDRLVSVSRRLRAERETAFYGDEEVGLPAERLYIAGDAEQALADARWVLALADAAIPPAP